MASKELNVVIQQRNDSAANWKTSTYVPLVGEICVENDTGLFKIGDGKSTFAALKYANDFNTAISAARDDMYSGTITDGQTVDAAITAALDGKTPKQGDMCVLKKTINGDKLSYTAYVYNGTAWAAMDGNYDASNVYFDSDLTYTANIGVKTVPSSGSGTIAAAGKNVKQVFADILALEKNPSTVQPTATLNSSNIGAKEVGTNIAIAYSFSTTAGSYTYGPATGVTFSGYEATFNKETKTGASGTFTSIQVKDDTSLTITGKCNSTAGATPKTNIGNDYAAGKIAAKAFTPSKGTLTGFRGWFYGYKNGTNAIADPTKITSAQVRALGSGTKTAFPSQLETNQMKQMFFAAPKGKKTSVSVADATNGAPQTVTKITDVMVEGANGYDAVAYDVWYVDNAAAASGSAKFNITVK